MTTSISPVNSLSYQIPENITFVKDPQQFNIQLTTVYTKMARAINLKDIGIYPNQEVLCGQTIFGLTTIAPIQADPKKFRNIYRKSFYFTGAGLTFAHGITGIVDATRIYGTVLVAGGIWQQMANNIDLQINGANIVITPGFAYPVITRGYITIEYTKE